MYSNSPRCLVNIIINHLHVSKRWVVVMIQSVHTCMCMCMCVCVCVYVVYVGKCSMSEINIIGKYI